MPTPTKSNFSHPNESAHPTANMAVDTVELGGRTFRRVTIQPGWRWTTDLALVVGTKTCRMEHLLYMLSGRMAVRADSGEEVEFAAGDLAHIPPGHDGWTVGDEPASWVEIPH